MLMTAINSIYLLAFNQMTGQFSKIEKFLTKKSQERLLDFLSPVYRLFPAPTNCPWVSKDDFYKEVLEKLRCLLLRNYIMFFLELGLQRAYGCTCTFFSVFGNHIISERGQFVICIGYVGLVFWNRC